MKLAARSNSKYAAEAMELLGARIRLERLARRMTAADLATRAGISRALLQRIERGDPGCSIGAVFEAASIVGVPLFAPDREGLRNQLAHTSETLALMPRAARPKTANVKDDF